jgi:signal transduction histidine kinase
VEGHIREARQTIWGLRSSAAPTSTLADVLRRLGTRLVADHGSFEMAVTGSPRRCPADVETELLRIAQEALMNAVRHASASHIRAELGFSWRALRLRVADNGRGFDPDKGARLDGHYGLSGIRERASALGGTCRIVSRPGAGSAVEVVLPRVPRWASIRLRS